MTEPPRGVRDAWYAQTLAEERQRMELHRNMDGLCAFCCRVRQRTPWPCGPYEYAAEIVAMIERGTR